MFDTKQFPTTLTATVYNWQYTLFYLDFRLRGNFRLLTMKFGQTVHYIIQCQWHWE